MQHNKNMKGKPRPARASDDAWQKYSYYLEKESGIKLTVAGTGKSEPFASMDYSDELKVKERAFSAFIHDAGINVRPGEIIASPLPRRYRTTTKRRAVFSANRISLSSDESADSPAISLLEPDLHTRIYSLLLQILNENINRSVARNLNFLIIRGSYTEFVLIFNVSLLGADIVKGCGKIAERIRESVPGISSAFIYHDPSASKYYFESIQPADGLRMKRLFGHANLAIRACGMLYTFHPAGFSQVNLSMSELMLEQARLLLSPPESADIVDLYCGYGFFSCSLAGNVSSVTGIDYDRNAIEHARSNMKRLHGECRYRFTSAAIEPEILARTLQRGRKGEYIILDPPRRGTQPGVIETLAERKPARVLHVFCGVETLPSEVKRWAGCGYRVKNISVLDMFPGTANLEVMVLHG
jgi:tRNA/tmRNA/rRNA uracil-C5-methylase (TrmA/RlmC/RlmD family)